MHPDTQLTVSNTRPMLIRPMVLITPPYPLVAWDNGALPSGATACFNVDRDGRAQDVAIKEVSIPDSGNPKLDQKIRVAVGADVRESLRESRFWPVKAHGRRVESPRVCQDFHFSHREYSMPRNGTWIMSKVRPKSIVPIFRIAPLVPRIAQANNSVNSSVTVCFKVEAGGRLDDVRITRIAIPDTGDKKLDRKIESALGAAVLGAVGKSLFFPRKVHGKPVETSHVCEDYTLRSTS